MPTARTTSQIHDKRHDRRIDVMDCGIACVDTVSGKTVGADLTVERRLALVLALLRHPVDRGESADVADVADVVEGINALLATIPSHSFRIDRQVEWEGRGLHAASREVVKDSYHLVAGESDARYVIQAINVTAPRVLLQGDLDGALVRVVRDTPDPTISGVVIKAPIGFEGEVRGGGVDEDGDVRIVDAVTGATRFAHASAVRVLEEAKAEPEPAPEQPEVVPLSAKLSIDYMRNIRFCIHRLRAEGKTPVKVRLRDDLTAGILKYYTFTTADPTKEPSGYTLHGLPVETFTSAEGSLRVWDVVVEPEPTPDPEKPLVEVLAKIIMREADFNTRGEIQRALDREGTLVTAAAEAARYGGRIHGTFHAALQHVGGPDLVDEAAQQRLLTLLTLEPERVGEVALRYSTYLLNPGMHEDAVEAATQYCIKSLAVDIVGDVVLTPVTVRLEHDHVRLLDRIIVAVATLPQAIVHAPTAGAGR